jgi:hypothetical protein
MALGRTDGGAAEQEEKERAADEHKVRESKHRADCSRDPAGLSQALAANHSAAGANLPQRYAAQDQSCDAQTNGGQTVTADGWE